MKFLYRVLKGLPLLSAVFSVWMINVCVRIINQNGENKFFLSILAVQVYLNWMAILLCSRNCIGAKRGRFFSSKIAKYQSDKIKYANTYLQDDKDSLLFYSEKKKYSSENVEKLWYCQKCCLNSREMCHHCPICNKCVMGRDHHCFLLGTCIGNQNMKHFIVILFYISLACLYTHLLLCSHMNLYNQSWYIIFQHLFPISFTKWLIGQEHVENMLDILLMNFTATMALFSFIFSINYLFNNTGICPENDQTVKNLISIKLRSICKGCFDGTLLNIIFPVSLLNYLLNETNFISINKN